MSQAQIYYITPFILQSKEYFEQICLDKTNSYYWSDDWSEEFYIQLAIAGFISTTHESKDGLLLLPELQHDYAVLHFDDLHISKNVKKLLKNSDYLFMINNDIDAVIQNIVNQHKYNWLQGKYITLLKNLYAKNEQNKKFQMISVELICSESKKLIAGEVGYIIGKTYTSLSGFSSREKQYANYGTLQLVLLAQHLHAEGFKLWNLGHPHMKYKKKLGCTIYNREDFLQRWNVLTHQTS